MRTVVTLRNTDHQPVVVTRTDRNNRTDYIDDLEANDDANLDTPAETTARLHQKGILQVTTAPAHDHPR